VASSASPFPCYTSSTSLISQQLRHPTSVQTNQSKQMIEKQRRTMNPIDSLLTTKRAKIELDNGLTSSYHCELRLI
jgi:hypothetical protein